MEELLKQRLKNLEQTYAKLCAQLGNIRANQNKLERQETQILLAIENLDNEAGKLKKELEQALKAPSA